MEEQKQVYLLGVNIGNRARFTVLRDYIRGTGRIDYDNDNITPLGGISTPANGCGGGQGSEKSGQIFLIDDFIQINMPTVYKNAQAGTIADITTGSLLCIMYTGQQSGTWACNFASRLTFKKNQTIKLLYFHTFIITHKQWAPFGLLLSPYKQLN